MSDLFEPTSVRVRDIPVWFRESRELLMRKPVAFAALALGYYFLAYSARTLGAFSLLFAVLLCQMGVMVGIVIAEAADSSRRMPLRPTFAIIRNVLWIELLLALIYTTVFLVCAVLGTLLPSGPALGYTHTELFSLLGWLWSGQIAFIVLYVGLMTLSSLWFVSPLLALHEIPFRTARSLSKRAERKNDWVIFVATWPPSLAFLALMFLSELSLVVSLCLFPLFTAYQYVVYRHVFLKKRKNKPAARSPVGSLAPVAEARRG